MDDDAPMPHRLERFLAEVEPDRKATVVSYTPITGGYSRVTGLAEIRWADGSHEKLITRADPRGGGGVFTSERDPEWRLLQALWKVDEVHIPRPRWYDATGEFMGSKCIVMDYVAGTPLQLTLEPGGDLSSATEVYLQVAEALQRIPLDALPDDLAHPPDWDAYLDGAIDIYDRAEHELSDSSPVIRYMAAWLRANKPPPVALRLVHGDFQPGNILVAEGREPVVIDWEFARIGDPREDVGYYSGSPLLNSLYTSDPDRFVSRYRELTGMSEEQVNREVLQYFFILGMAELFAQIMRGADALAMGRGKGVMNMFLINSLSYFHHEYLDICRPSPTRRAIP